MTKVDLAIVGSGPAGLTASIYASRYRVAHIVYGKRQGGTIGYAHAVENYPGFVSISGLDLMAQVEEQAKKLGAQVEYDPVAKIVKKGSFFQLETKSGSQVEVKTLILATGTSRRKLGVSGEVGLLGRGVSYCTTCDAPFFKDKTIALIGGSDGAVSGAIHAAAFAKKVYLIYRGDQLRAEPVWVKKAQDNPKIEVIYQTNVVKILGEKLVSGVGLDRAWQNQKTLGLEGVFIEIGGIPENMLGEFLKLAVNEVGYLKVNRKMETSLEGVYGAGDNTDFWPHFQQVVAAQAMGAMAASSVYEYLRRSE
ncbi:FAD-dependent oxidoreductase [Patescibacteria group bacterium]|nr:FAD-dependent oxidoreductase [Patescibacteria group bacterium]